MSRILIIEDEPAIQMLLQRIISRMGHDSVSAVDGTQAHQIVQTDSFDLILTDLHMPGEPTGLPLVKAIRDHLPQCPVVILTGSSVNEFAPQCELMGIRTFLPKPFDIALARSVIGTFCPPTPPPA